jgi:hypothetical protein
MRLKKLFHSLRFISSVCSAIALLAGCGNAGSELAPTGSTQPNVRSIGVNATHPHGRSWMAPDAKNENLVYVSDGSGSSSSNEVYVYSYPEGKLKGTLTDVDNPQGMCVDAAGDVWVTNNSGTTGLTEFAHGGTKPIATLTDPNELPDGCAIDPATGNLAVTSLCQQPSCFSGGPGDLAIFKDAKGTPTTYSDSSISDFYFCGYDASGNLFLDGASTKGTTIAELASGSNSLVNIKLNFVTINYPGGVQWDGQYLAIGDQAYEGSQGRCNLSV